MKRLTTILMALCTIGCGTHGSPSDAASQVTMASLLDEMISYDAVTGYPAVNYRAAQVSSYDRRTVDLHEPGWFANDDGAGFERLDTTINGERCGSISTEQVRLKSRFQPMIWHASR